MLKIKIIGTDNKAVSRDEIFTFYISDMLYNPYHRRMNVLNDGSVEFALEEEPVMVHGKLKIPGFGHMWVLADNFGRGYKNGEDIDFVREAALCRINETENYLAKWSFKASAECLSALSDAKAKARLGEIKPNNAGLYNMSALSSALWAGERAALERARDVIKNRAKRDFLFGCGGFTYPFSDSEKTKMYDSIFNFATLPFYLARLEQEKERPDYSTLDALQDAFEKSNIITKGHPLWWTHTAGMPPWTENLKWEGGAKVPGSIAHEIDRVVKRSVKRYKGRIKIYDAINEAHDWCNAYKLSQDELVKMTKLCCDAMHEEDSNVKAVINNCFMFGENVADERVQWGIINKRNMTPYTYMQKVHEMNTQYDVLGIQLYCPSRDMLEIEKMYDRFSVFGKPLHLTELGVPSHYEDVRFNATEGDLYCLRYMYSGLWHEDSWSQRLQADWMEWFYTISYAHKSVEALTWWSFNDPGFIPGAGMYNSEGDPKEICFRLRALQEEWGFSF